VDCGFWCHERSHCLFSSFLPCWPFSSLTHLVSTFFRSRCSPLSGFFSGMALLVVFHITNLRFSVSPVYSPSFFLSQIKFPSSAPFSQGTCHRLQEVFAPLFRLPWFFTSLSLLSRMHLPFLLSRIFFGTF